MLPTPSRVALLTLTMSIAMTGGLLSACGPQSSDVDAGDVPTSPPVVTSPIPQGDDVTIDRVIDGDTVETTRGTRVRLIGIDTPETVKPDTPVQCYGPEASAATKSLLHQGTRVRLVYDIEPEDRYGRTLAYAFRTDGLFVNAYLVRGGYAKSLVVKPNTRYTSQLRILESAAQRENRGLWGRC